MWYKIIFISKTQESPNANLRHILSYPLDIQDIHIFLHPIKNPVFVD